MWACRKLVKIWRNISILYLVEILDFPSSREFKKTFIYVVEILEDFPSSREF